jgi:hypothetical protein
LLFLHMSAIIIVSLAMNMTRIINVMSVMAIFLIYIGVIIVVVVTVLNTALNKQLSFMILRQIVLLQSIQ